MVRPSGRANVTSNKKNLCGFRPPSCCSSQVPPATSCSRHQNGRACTIIKSTIHCILEHIFGHREYTSFAKQCIQIRNALLPRMRTRCLHHRSKSGCHVECPAHSPVRYILMLVLYMALVNLFDLRQAIHVLQHGSWET